MCAERQGEAPLGARRRSRLSKSSRAPLADRARVSDFRPEQRGAHRLNVGLRRNNRVSGGVFRGVEVKWEGRRVLPGDRGRLGGGGDNGRRCWEGDNWDSEFRKR